MRGGGSGSDQFGQVRLLSSSMHKKVQTQAKVVSFLQQTSAAKRALMLDDDCCCCLFTSFVFPFNSSSPSFPLLLIHIWGQSNQHSIPYHSSVIGDDHLPIKSKCALSPISFIAITVTAIIITHYQCPLGYCLLSDGNGNCRQSCRKKEQKPNCSLTGGKWERKGERGRWLDGYFHLLQPADEERQIK